MLNIQTKRQTVNSTTGKALAYLRDLILSGKLPSGTPLPTKNLAEEIGVSRTPVRDALRQLETEGLVTIIPRQEARVKELTVEEDHAIGELQIALEAYAAQLAALRRSEEDLAKIRQHHTALMEWAAHPAPLTQEEARVRVHVLDEADARFHLAIMQTSRNGQVEAEALRLRLIRSLTRLPQSAKTLSAEEMLKAHERIVHAIEIQSAEGAYAAMRDHLEESLKRRFRALKAIRDQELQQALGSSPFIP